MACNHVWSPCNIDEYFLCERCGTYKSMLPHNELFYSSAYWGENGHCTVHEQAWNVDMELERGVSKNAFVLSKIAVNRDSALDVGCAPGRLLYWLKWAARFKRVVGIDSFPETDQIRAVGCFDGTIITGLFPRVARSLTFGSFELVTALDIFEHSTKPEEFLGECFRLLRAKGQLLLMLPLADNLRQGSRFFAPKEHAYLHSLQNLIAMLREAGFEDLQTDRWTLGHDTISARKS